MPVLATMTILALLRGDSSADQPFFDPALLRELLAEGLDGEPGERVAEAMALADELETLIDNYIARVDSVIDGYIDVSEDPRANAATLNGRLAALDKERSKLMREIIRIRRSLAGVLSGEQWQAVFD